MLIKGDSYGEFDCCILCRGGGCFKVMFLLTHMHDDSEISMRVNDISCISSSFTITIEYERPQTDTENHVNTRIQLYLTILSRAGAHIRNGNSLIDTMI